MRALITGVAGFIGSTIADTLLASGHDVVGVDCFTPYYPREYKEANLAVATASERFEFRAVDLRTDPLEALLTDVDVVFHSAAQPGVRLSWASGFAEYNDCNVLATQRLLEAARSSAVRRLVYASSSSVYYNPNLEPTRPFRLRLADLQP